MAGARAAELVLDLLSEVAAVAIDDRAKQGGALTRQAVGQALGQAVAPGLQRVIRAGPEEASLADAQVLGQLKVV